MARVAYEIPAAPAYINENQKTVTHSRSLFGIFLREDIASQCVTLVLFWKNEWDGYKRAL